MTIKPYEDKYLNDCREIMIKTAPTRQVKTEKGKKATLNLYCDFYLEFSPDTCFVVANENDKAVGVILCHPNFNKYEQDFRKYYLKNTYKISFFAGLMRSFLFKVERLYAKKYPAHLHIDILDGYQRMGLGHKLVNALTERLKELNVGGLYLIVGNVNKKGVSFYKKYGFKKYKSLFGQATVFGLEIKG